MHTLGRDTWEVTICRIPAEHDSTLYADGALTYLGTAQQIVSSLEAVTKYFSRWSMGRYRIEFEAAERDVKPTYGDPETCLDGALAQSRSESDGVLVVADRQHREGRNGGSGTWGTECTGNCQLAARVGRSIWEPRTSSDWTVHGFESIWSNTRSATLSVGPTAPVEQSTTTWWTS